MASEWPAVCSSAQDGASKGLNEKAGGVPYRDLHRCNGLLLCLERYFVVICTNANGFCLENTTDRGLGNPHLFIIAINLRLWHRPL